MCGASRRPIQYNPDCPPSIDKALAEFAAQARELRRARKKTKTAVTIRLDPESLDAYKALGQGYTTVMADVLAYAAKNPDVLSRLRA